MGSREVRGSAFVGREEELRLLEAELADASAGRGRLVAIAGDPGIGKTRVVEEFIARAALPTGRVVWGPCPEHPGAPPYWPWQQAIRAYAETNDPTTVASQLGAEAADIARLVPALRRHVSGREDGAPAVESDEWRFRLFDAVTSFLRRVTDRVPLVMVLDDLHWADPASLQLLTFLARELRGMRLLVLVTYRPLEVESRPGLVESLGRAARRIQLRGFGREEVGEVIHRMTDVRPASGMVDDIHRVTEGNPFFLGELVRMLDAEAMLGSPDLASLPIRIPAELRATIRQRLAPLNDDQRRLLEMAAVVGREFDVGLLEVACELERDRVLEQLGAAISARLLDERLTALGQGRFAHALIRETLYEDLAPGQRSLLHRRVGRALEHLSAGSLDRPYGELAHHFFRAAPLGDAVTALEYAERAGEQAAAQFGYEEAVGHFERATQLLAMLPPDRARRVALQLALGNAALRASDTRKARAAFEQAAHDADSLGDADALARAALGYQDARIPAGVVDPTEVRLLEDALRGLGNDDSALRSRMVLGLGRALMYAEPERSRDLADEALAIARRVGEPVALATALWAKHFLMMGPGDLRARLPVLMEAIALAERAHAPSIAFASRASLVHDLLESGDIVSAEREIDALARDPEHSRLPVRRWIVAVLRASLAVSSGRVEEGARLSAQAMQLRRDGQDPAVLMTHCGQMFVARREIGALGESLEQSIALFADSYPGMHSWPCTLAVAHAEAGRADAARELVERLGRQGFTDVPRDVHYLPALAMLAEAVHLLGDTARAEQLYPLLLPHADRNVVASWWSPAYVGSVARYLGLLAATAGRLDDAARHFEDAATANARMGIRGQLAHTRVDHASVLFTRNDPGDREHGMRLLAEARTTAEELGLGHLRQGIAQIALPPLPAETPSGTSEQSATLRRDGPHWTVGMGGHTVQLKDGPGLAYLAALVREPGREFHVLDLSVGTDGPAGAARQAYASNAGELLDAPARAAYKRRLLDLETELEEAERFNDPGRMVRVQQEREFLQAELTRAVGLRGRSRRAGAASERARVNVTKVLGRTIDKIAAGHPVLGQHLAAAVRRGLYCSYTPDPRLALRWEV